MLWVGPALRAWIVRNDPRVRLPPRPSSPRRSADGSAIDCHTHLRDPDLVAIRSRWTLCSALHSCPTFGYERTRLLRIATVLAVAGRKKYS